MSAANEEKWELKTPIRARPRPGVADGCGDAPVNAWRYRRGHIGLFCSAAYGKTCCLFPSTDGKFGARDGYG